jgi:uncharacterized protein YndB with AHSA1/START domain
MATQAAPATSVEVRRTIRAPQQRVFDAWTKPDEVKRWHSPGPSVVREADMDLRVGGAWSLLMHNAQGEDHWVRGVYREVDPPRRIVYTWGWDTPGRATNTVVTVEFHDRGGSTEVVVRHDGLATADDRERHTMGWEAGLGKLEAMFA